MKTGKNLKSYGMKEGRKKKWKKKCKYKRNISEIKTRNEL